MRSSIFILPDRLTISSVALPSMATFSMPGNRKGWLAALRSCASRLISRLLSVRTAALVDAWALACPTVSSAEPVSMRVSMSWSRRRRRRDTSLCVSDMGQLIFVSTLGGSFVSTSLFRRRSTKGRMISCILVTMRFCSCVLRMSSTCVSCPMFRKSNQERKTSRSSKIIGEQKFSRDHSSSSEFWMGVPVSSSLETDWICLSSRISLQFLFLMRCPSSRMMYCHTYFSRCGLSAMQMSKLVTTTGKLSSFALPTGMCFLRSSSRCCLSP
mmetsp:Transcript_32719/g.72008  ORF Transcript_32719/g.72008 Transcript_32719/m.72008 type:complete len:270 (+) Transcript_32719:381-1190(+)